MCILLTQTAPTKTFFISPQTNWHWFDDPDWQVAEECRQGGEEHCWDGTESQQSEYRTTLSVEYKSKPES